MDPDIIVSIQAALDHLESCINKYDFENGRSKVIEAVIYRLRCIRTFVICSTKVGVDTELISLWGSLDDIVRTILKEEFSPYSLQGDFERFFVDIGPFVEDMDKWFVNLSKCYLQQFTDLLTPVSGHVIEEILGSVVENFKDSLMFYDESYEDQGYDLFFQLIKGLKEYMSFLRNFIRFASFLCDDQHQVVQILFTKIEAHAVSAAHLTVHIFTFDEDNTDRINSITSALQLMIKPLQDPQLCEIYSLALANLKCSRELLTLTLHDPINIVMIELISYLLSLLRDLLESDALSANTPHDSQLRTLFDGLRSLTTFIEMLPSMFHGEIRDATRVVMCNAGVIIFSINQSDFVIESELEDFLGNIKVIQSEFEEEKLNFPGMTVLAFLDSLMDYMKKVNSSKVDSSVLGCVPKIREDVAYLISFMGMLMELRKHQEDLHQGLWNLGVELAYKLEFLVDQLVLGNIL